MFTVRYGDLKLGRKVKFICKAEAFIESDEQSYGGIYHVYASNVRIAKKKALNEMKRIAKFFNKDITLFEGWIADKTMCEIAHKKIGQSNFKYKETGKDVFYKEEIYNNYNEND